jgi:hypothetical protein
MYEIELDLIFGIGIPAILLIPEYIRSIGPIQTARNMLRHHISEAKVQEYL